MSARHWPTELRLKTGGRLLSIAFEDATYELEAEYLRIASPSAEVQGHGPAERKTLGGKREVVIRALEPVGHYAIKLIFDDGHDSGLYTWQYLHDLGSDATTRWAAYLEQLAAKGLSRDRPGQA